MPLGNKSSIIAHQEETRRRYQCSNETPGFPTIEVKQVLETYFNFIGVHSCVGKKNFCIFDSSRLVHPDLFRKNETFI